MSSFKKLSKSDVTVVPYSANKQWTLPYCPYPTSSDYLTIYKGTNVTGSFSLDDDVVTEGQYERLVYTQINQLFYQDSILIYSKALEQLLEEFYCLVLLALEKQCWLKQLRRNANLHFLMYPALPLLQSTSETLRN